jgi:uncharacterized membrane protein
MLTMRESSAAERLITAGVCGAIAGAIAIVFVNWELAVLIAWDVAAADLVVRHWVQFMRLTPQEVKAHAVAEDDTRVGSDVAVLVAAVASLLGVGFTVYEAGNAQGLARYGYAGVGVATVIASWFAVHTVFTLRYARLYHAPPAGGISFNDDAEDPDYTDFAYVAFTVGMTFQVSDTDVSQRNIRRLVLRHMLISYLFGAVIVAVTVNMVANVLQ